MEKIKESKKPQVLVVDHDDAVSLSGGESDVDTEDDDDDMTGFSPLRAADIMTTDVMATEEQENNSKMLPSGCYCFCALFSLHSFVVHPFTAISCPAYCQSFR